MLRSPCPALPSEKPFPPSMNKQTSKGRLLEAAVLMLGLALALLLMSTGNAAPLISF
jgi:hypothetical protein